jgi:hypothetical protein
MTKTFKDFIAEAKDSQKSKVNNDMHSKDATHGEKPQVLDTKVKADGNNYEGDKPDILDTSINEADAQKEKENSDLKAKDASHGEKAQVIKEEGEDDEDDEDDEKVIYGDEDKDGKDCDDEEELDEKLNEAKLFEASLNGTEKAIIADNVGRKRGDEVIIKGKEDSSSFIVNVGKTSITFVRHGGGQITIYSFDSSGKNVIYLDDSEVDFINKNT